MNKFVFGITFILYVLFIDYVNSMLVFDFRKYIKKDKLLKDLKFSINLLNGKKYMLKEKLMKD